ncbi:hypothetical protein [Methylobacter sp. YRD-M1]|uniref:hypothetical protein n=1 Tax=Methylobacter sp. YRD-M1 TaxID=2911520 RepID=UPI00227BDDFC|nr:hypothetical protein [Methylobacter sp. YRD-M1]WAK04082.1 hypothetical protein LZ558_09935 [Methylobacter sp. YRD-M1]
MIIRISFLLFLLSLPVLVLAEVLLWLKIPGVPELAAKLGSAMLLGALIILIIAALLAIPKLVIRSALTYFSAGERLQRRLMFVQSQQEHVRQLFHFRALKVKYLSEMRRKRLLKANNRKHIRSLSKSIHKDLLAVKKELPKATFKQLRQDNIRYRKRQDIEALLKLQQKIATLV